eukprot:JP448585.1.p2 GENE.JP448585.1~~JP448585.1.p2  ORF type:complete len:109 (+),score=23.15 JP448585.1:35-361(+)
MKASLAILALTLALCALALPVTDLKDDMLSTDISVSNADVKGKGRGSGELEDIPTTPAPVVATPAPIVARTTPSPTEGVADGAVASHMYDSTMYGTNRDDIDHYADLE